MPRPWLRGLFPTSRRGKAADASRGNSESEASPERSSKGTNIQTAFRLSRTGSVNNQARLPGAPSSMAPCSAIESTAPEPTLPTQRGSDAGQAAHIPLEPHNEQNYNIPTPYATTPDLWNEASKSLDDSQIHDIEKSIGNVDVDSKEGAKATAVTIRDKISRIFEEKEHDDKVNHIVKNTISILDKFVSVVDVAVSYDPVHAALPWAVVRFVLTTLILRSELKSQLLVGVAKVASLLVQCDTCHQLYMTPDPDLRPPESVLETLRQRIIQAYAKSQGFLSFAFRLQQSRMGPVASPFKLPDLKAHVDELAECEKGLARVTEDCEKHCASSHRDDVRKFQELSRSFYRNIQDQLTLALDLIEEGNLFETLEWISSVQYRSHHYRVKEARTPSTCEWLLNHEKFHEWEAGSSAVLWLQGSPGAGKTFLASKVIDHVQTQLESSSYPAGFAFFYCDRNDEQRRSPLSVLQCLVRQLSTSAQNPECVRKSVQDLYRKRRMESSGLNLADCKEQLLQSVNRYEQTTIVLDALDECEPGSRLEIITAIESAFASRKSFKVFISSRRDRDIRKRFSNKPNIDIQATHNEKDIKKFVHEKITKHGNWDDMSTSLRGHIVRVLLERSEGMFQWVFLQTKELLNLETEQAIIERLGTLPTGLKSLYDEIYSKIKARSRHDRILVENAFKWVMCAWRPLKSEELLSAIRLDSAGDTFDLAENITESQLLHLCNNLLVLDSQRKIWRFSHLSVTEYFEKNHWNRQKADCHAAIVCLKLLLKAHFKYEDLEKNESWQYPRRFIWNIAKYSTDGGPFDKRDEQRRRSGELDKEMMFHSSHPLQKYARTEWVRHTQTQEGQERPDPILSRLLSSFLGSPEESSLQYRQWYELMNRLEEINTCLDNAYDLEYDLAPPTVSLFAVCRFSFYTILSDWWDVAVFDTSLTNEDGLTPLALAAKGGHKSICKDLVQRGADVNLHLRNRDYGSALAAAARSGNLEVVKFLIHEAKADVNLQLRSGNCGSALAAAAMSGYFEIVKFLVCEAKADVNLQLLDGNYGSALAAAAAAWSGNLEIIKFLVCEAKADVNLQLQNGDYGSVLEAAVRSGNLEIVKFLVCEAKADVNLQLLNGNYGSALAAAAWSGNLGVVEYLVDKAKADVNLQLQNELVGSALAAAAGWQDNLGVVEFLIHKANVDVDQQIRNGRACSALATAAFWGSEACADLLITAGANVNLKIENGPFATALQAAQASLSEEDVQFLRQIHHKYMFEDELELLKQRKIKVVEMLRLYGAVDDGRII